MVLEVQTNNIIIVDGPQGAGKSYLIDNFVKDNKDFLLFRFSFSKIINQLNKSEDMSFKNGVSACRDISIIVLLYSLKQYPNTIMERGFLSHVVWGILEDRENIDSINSYIDIVNDLIESMNVHFILVHGKHPNYVRYKKDGYDNIVDHNKQFFYYVKYHNRFRFKSVHYFNNIFKEKSIIDFKNIIGEICNE